MNKNLWQKLIYYNLKDEYNKIKIIQDNEKLFNIYDDKCKDIKINNGKDKKFIKAKEGLNENYSSKKKLYLALIIIAFSLALVFSILYICTILKYNHMKVKNINDNNIEYTALLIYETNQLNEKISLISDKNSDDNELGFFTRERSKFNLIDLEKNIYINSSDYFFEKKGTHLIKLEFNESILDFSFMFYECKNLLSIANNFKVEKAINFKSMFNGCISLIYIANIQEWDVSYGIDFSYMFYNCTSLNQIIDLNTWDTSSGLYFNNMFSNCSSLININPISLWNVKKGIDFSKMFYGCSNLRYANDISLWNTNKYSEFKEMFYDCEKLESISKLINKYGNNIVNYGVLIYKTTEKNQEIQIIGNYLNKYDNKKGYYKLLANNNTFNNIELIYGEKTIEIKKISNDEYFPYDIMKTFENPGKHEIKIKIKKKIDSLDYLFYNCTNLIRIIGYFDINIIVNFEYMFYNCSSLTDINGLSNWNVSNGINFNYMFYNCDSLTDINGLSNWNVSNGINFEYMFYNFHSLTDINGLSNWNVSNGINFDSMFKIVFH